MRLRNGQLSWREFDGETVVLDLAGSRYLTVNATGTVLLKRLADGCARADLVTALVDGFAISDEAAAADVDAFVMKLEQKGLLEPS